MSFSRAMIVCVVLITLLSGCKKAIPPPTPTSGSVSASITAGRLNDVHF